MSDIILRVNSIRRMRSIVMATTEKKRVRRLRKREVKFIRDRLQGLDLEIMEAFVIREAEAVEYHVARYPERQALWTHFKSSKKLMEFLREESATW